MKEVLDILKQYHIPYQMVEHAPVFTVEQSQMIKEKIMGIGCKNLFLKDKDDYFVVILNEQSSISLKDIQAQILSKRLSFGTEEELYQILNLKKGSVTPFGILNDKDKKCIIVIEECLKNNQLLFHPNTNEATISITYNDLIKFINLQAHNYKILR